MTRTNPPQGFTLIELNLAILFVAILLLAVAMTIMGVGRTYEYGVSLKAVNQTGREVVDQLRRDMAAAQPEQVSFEYTGGVGRLCLGSVSYVYNDAQLLDAPSGEVQDQTQSGNPPITFARIEDIGGVWCLKNVLGTAYIKNHIQTGDTYTEILQRDTVPMAIHSMNAVVFAEATDENYPESLIHLQLVLGTNETNTLDGAECKPPTEPGQNFSNCAVREFVTVVRVAGGGNR